MMFRIIKKVIKKIQLIQYHLHHKKIATKALSNIEKDGVQLSPELKSLCDSYAVDKFGAKKYAHWLYVYAAISGEFHEGWIPDNYYGELVVPNYKGKYGEIGDRKTLTNLLFPSANFPDLLYIVNSLFLTPEYSVLSKQEAIDYLYRSTNKVIFKEEGSSQGKGVSIIDLQELDTSNICSLDNGVFQKYIKQHSFFSEIESNSVATIRMTTATDSIGIPSLRGCYLRVGRSNDRFVKSKSHIRVAVDLNTGELSNVGYTPDWQRIDKHPDSNYVFKDKKIPNFQKAKEEILSLHRRIPYIRVIGWDLIIDNENNIQVMEFNGNHNDIKFSEATQGPILKDFNI